MIWRGERDQRVSIIIDIIRKGLEMDHVMQYIGLRPVTVGSIHTFCHCGSEENGSLCIVRGFFLYSVTCLKGMDIIRYVFMTVNDFRPVFF